MYTKPTLRDKVRAMPLLRALVPMVAGIVAGTLLGDVPLYAWAIAAAVCGATAWLARVRRGVATLYVALAIVCFGAGLARIHTPRAVTPQGERLELELVITDSPVLRGRSAHTSGVVVGTGEKLSVGIDTMWRFEAGDRVAFRGYVNPVSDSVDSYGRLMRARGYVGRTYISRYSRPEVTGSEVPLPRRWAKRLQKGASGRLRRLDLPPEGIAVAAAMTTGDRSEITPALRRAYSRTGAAHLLAVSGLHVGIVFLMINALLYLLPLARGGHIAKNIIAVAVVWLYAALTGLSPSATRAAFMFTGAQVALAASQTRNAANIMCGTAVVMLAVRPGLLFDIGFQLSFISVAAILAWFGPLYRLVASRWRALNALWATLIVGLVASVATMPLVSHTFGVFSPAGVVLNPIVIVTAHLAVGFSLLWVAMPAEWLSPLFERLVGAPVWLQNRTVELASEVTGAAIEWTMPAWAVFVVYAAMIIFTVWMAARPTRGEKPESFVLL